MTPPDRRLPPVVIAGPSASGKGVAKRALQSLGFHTFELSAGIPRWVAPTTLFEERLVKLTRLYEQTSGRLLIDWLMPELEQAWLSGNIAVIGARQQPEIQQIRVRFGAALVVGIYAPTELRFERAQMRHRADTPLTIEQFLRLTFWEYSLGLAAILHRAQYLLVNVGTEAELEAALLRIINEERSSSLELPPMV